MYFYRVLVGFCEFVVFFRVCSWNSKVFQLASRLFQLIFLDFQGFSVGLCDFRRFFSLLVGPLQVFQLDGQTYDVNVIFLIYASSAGLRHLYASALLDASMLTYLAGLVFRGQSRAMLALSPWF